MKKYLLVAFNWIRLLRFRISNKVVAHVIQSFDLRMKFELKRNSKLILGRNIVSDGSGSIYIGENATVKIEDGTYFNDGIKISCKENITIGKQCLFGPDVKIYDNNHCFSVEEGVSFDYTADSIMIGDKCWIASNVVILKGTNIGKHSVIGAGCVVSGIIPAGSIVKQDYKLKIIPMKTNGD